MQSLLRSKEPSYGGKRYPHGHDVLRCKDNHGVDEMKWYVDYVISRELHAGDFSVVNVNFEFG